MRLLDRINPWRRIRMLIALNKRLNEDLEIESEAHAMEQAEAVRQFSRADALQDELDKLKTDYHNLVGNASFSSVDMSFARRRIGKLEATLKLALAVIVTKVNPLDVDAKWYRESMDLVPLDSKKG